MEILENIEIVDGYPALYLKKLETLIIADLHLGLEWAMTQEGIFIPTTQYQEILKDLQYLLAEKQPRLLIINGDLKHEFSKATSQEWREVIDLLAYLDKNVEKTIVIRGNHDNFIRGFFKRYNNIDFIEPYLQLENYLLTHGHKEIEKEILENKKHDVIIVAHEHPAILLVDDLGAKIKTRAFLHGKTNQGKEIIVLPAFSPLATGIEINLVPQEELLSPILKEHVNIMQLEVYAIDKKTGTLKFPKLALWHGLTRL